MKPSRSPRFQSLAERASAAAISRAGSPVEILGAAQAPRAPQRTMCHALHTSSFAGRQNVPCRMADATPELVGLVKTVVYGPVRFTPARDEPRREPAPGTVQAVQLRLSLLRVRLQHREGRADPVAVPRRGGARVAARPGAVAGSSGLDHVVRQRGAHPAPTFRGRGRSGAGGPRRHRAGNARRRALERGPRRHACDPRGVAAARCALHEARSRSARAGQRRGNRCCEPWRTRTGPCGR